MCDEHVVEGDQIALLPGSFHAKLLVYLTDPVDDIVRDRRPVAVIHVAGKVLIGKQLPHGCPRLLIQARHVMQLHLVEEDPLARTRMHPDALRALANAQPELGPLAGHPGIRAGLFNGSLVVGLEELLPWHVDALGEVAHIHQAPVLERLHDLFVERLVDLAAVQ